MFAAPETETLKTEGAVPQSEVILAARPTPLSKRLWNIDWERELPWRAGDLTIEFGSAEAARPFIEEHLAAMHSPTDNRFFVEPMSDAKRAFMLEMDFFLFRDGDKTVGLSAAHPTDWSTYYFRTIGLLPEYRERGLLNAFRDGLDPVLSRAGVARREVQTSPANVPMNRFFFSDGSIVTSMTTSERFGVMLTYTHFLSAEAKNVFARQYVNVPTHGRQGR